MHTCVFFIFIKKQEKKKQKRLTRNYKKGSNTMNMVTSETISVVICENMKIITSLWM